MPRGVPNVKPAEPDETPEVESESPEVEAETDEAPEAPEAEVVEAVTEHRHEVFEATRPDGTVVIVDRNIDTGEQTVTE